MSDVGQKIEQAKIIMNENVAGNVDPEELAMRLNISYSWFHRVFKEYTGYAPAKYFQELKLRISAAPETVLPQHRRITDYTTAQ